MQCIMCKRGSTTPGSTTMTLERATTTVVFKHIPSEICQVCGEAYLDDATTQRLLYAVEEAVRAGVVLQVRSYPA